MTAPRTAPRPHRTPAGIAASRVLALTIALLAGFGASQEAPTVREVQAYDPARGAVVAPLAGDATIDLSAFTTRRVGVLARSTTSTSRVVFEVDGRTVATPDERPFLTTFDVTADRSLIFAERAASADTVEVGIGAGAGDVEEFVRASSDDPSSFPEGYTYTRSSDLELGHDPDHAAQRIALRFAGVAVPQGAIVTAAEVVFTADGDSSGPLTVTVRGEKSPDAARFVQDENGTGSAAIAARPVTAEEHRWALGSDDSWTAGETYATPDLSEIVQEIVDQETWRAGAALVLTISSDADGMRRAVSYDAAPSRAPRLRVSYRMEAEQVVLQPGPHRMTVTPYGEAGAGEPVEVRFDVVERQPEPEPATQEERTPETPAPDAIVPDADPPAPPAAPAVPEAPEPANAPDAPPTPIVPEQEEPELRAEPAEPARPAVGTTRLRFPLHSTEDDRVVGSILLSVYPGILPVVTLQANRPFDRPVVVVVRSQGCRPTGELVTTATTVSEAPGIIVGTLDLGVGTLLAAQFGIHVVDAATGASLACSSLESVLE